ncbi:MAG: YhfC family glutamic-type intramembrane protease [bacterium]
MNFYIWAGIVTVVGLVILYLWVGRWGLREIKYFYLYSLLTLPLSALVNLAVKRPIALKLLALFNLEEEPKLWPLWFLPIGILLAPVTEETIKILPVIFSDLRQVLKEKKKALIAGLILGFGFGIGEAWYLAFSLTQKMPEYASGSFWLLFGFFNERLMAIVVHGCMTAIVLMGFYRNFLKYYLLAVLFHYLGNIGAAFYQSGYLSVEVAYIPIIVVVFLLFSYIFRIERQLRKENNIMKKETILYQRDDR